MTFTRTALKISAGVILWALHFGVIYGFTGLACARGWAPLVPSVVYGATAVAGAAALALVIVGFLDRAEFESWLSGTIAAFALVAIVFEAIPVLLVPICG